MQTDALTVTIKPLDETNPTALFRHYDGETYAQSCHIELDLRDGELTADYDGEIGNAVPMTVWHGIVRRWGIPCLTAEAANTLMREIAPLAQRVLDGASIEWDGNNNVGRLTDDAQAAEEELLGLLAGDVELTTVCEEEASDWWSEGGLPEDLTADTTDEELAAIVEREEQDATTMQADVYTVLTGAEEYLTARREEMRDVVREELEQVAEQHAQLEERRNQLIRRTTAFGDSSRSTGARASLSHVAVQKIAQRSAE